MEESLDFILHHLRSQGSPLQHCVINAGKVVLAQAHPDLADIVNRCPLINADGMAVVWAARFLGSPMPERVAGIDLMFELLGRVAQTGHRVFLLGAREDVVQRVADTFKVDYPGINICGFRDGYWSPEEEPHVVAEIAAHNPDILLLAFSSPKKEIFANRYLNELGARVIIGVGGSFDVVAGVTKRAPVWMQRSGLEWFYRFAQEPIRMFKRYVIGNLHFALIVIRQRFRG